MRLFTLALLFLAQAAGAQSLSVTPLYDSSSQQPNALIPFRVQGAAMNAGAIQATRVSLLGASDADCRAMKDPFARDIVLLKCTQEARVTLHVSVSNGSGLLTLDYGPVTVKMPAPNLQPVNPNPVDPAILAGRQLFNTYCIACHQPSEKANRNAAQLKAATTRPEMSFLAPLLNADAYNKLTAYLGSL